MWGCICLAKEDNGDVQAGKKEGPVSSTKIYQEMTVPGTREFAKFWNYKEDSNPQTDHKEVPAFQDTKSGR